MSEPGEDSGEDPAAADRGEQDHSRGSVFSGTLGATASPPLSPCCGHRSQRPSTSAGADDEEIPVHELLRTERRPLVIGSLLNGYQSLTYYVIVTFVPTYLVSFQGARPEEGILAGMIAAVVFAVGSPIAGGLCDRVGRKPVMYAAALATTTELFNTRTRYTGVSVSFNIGATVFGGTAPLIATALIKVLDTDQAPASCSSRPPYWS